MAPPTPGSYQRYDAALLYVDVDEIVAPDPHGGTLGDYIDGFPGRDSPTRGYEVIHMREVPEPAPLHL